MASKDSKYIRWSIEGAQLFSTCSKAQYMAIIVSAEGIVVGTGYNGSPPRMKHCVDGGCPRAVNNVPSGTPYDYGDGLCVAVHAEVNAISHSDRSARLGGTLYVNGVPCFGCAKVIAGSGIKRICYLDNAHVRTDSSDSLKILEESGVELAPHSLDLTQ